MVAFKQIYEKEKYCVICREFEVMKFIEYISENTEIRWKWDQYSRRKPIEDMGDTSLPCEYNVFYIKNNLMRYDCNESVETVMHYSHIQNFHSSETYFFTDISFHGFIHIDQERLIEFLSDGN